MIEKLTGKPGGMIALPRHVVGFVRWRLVRKILRKHGSPRLHELYVASDLWTTEPRELIGWIELDDAQTSDPLEPPAPTGSSTNARKFPDFFDMETKSLDFMSRLVVSMRPDVVVETGVANGASTNAILSAMSHIDHGHLHSFDVDPRTRDSVATNHHNWDFHLIDGSLDSLNSVVSRLGPLDVFIHDSDHSYDHQMGEYELGLSRLRTGGILVSDDIDWTYAWLDFTERHRLPFAVLMDRRKCLGIAIKK